ncbi:MAG: hypothetical protein D6731_10965 [Planctomycetota bacterium]|nr:MAG: hypothetical protein D6731_10965 [Planctomycetota bacterium]
MHRLRPSTWFLAGAVWGGLLAAAGAEQQTLAPRTLKRTEDTIVLEGKALGPRLLGAHKDRLRAYAARGGFLTPIPFQVDERDQRGRYCYTGGPPERRRRDVDKGKVDVNDEFCVLARDLGERANPALFATVAGATAVEEFEVRDPVDGGRAWFYVFRFDGLAVPGRPGDDYVSLRVKPLDDERGIYFWRGERFAFNNRRSPTNAVRATFATIAGPGEDPRAKPNMLDATQVRSTVSFMWVTVTRHSDEFRVRIGGVIDGPLRLIGENIAKVYLALGIWVSLSESYVILWRNRVSMPTNVECPVNLDEGDVSNYELGMDLARRVAGKGWAFYNSRNPKPVVIDGKMSAAERALDLRYPDWNVVYGPGGAVVSKFVIPDFLARRKGSRLVYRDDARHRAEEGLEFEPGSYGYHAYLMDMAGLKEGFYQGDYIVWYAPPPFRPGDERRLLDEYERPLRVVRTSSVSPDER